MKQVAWMTGASVATWLAALAAVGETSGPAVFFGMLAPLVMASASWVMAERTYKRDPQALTGLLISAFAFKMVFFGGYVAVMLRGFHLRPVPFVVSFSSYFIALHLFEAVLLQRLFTGGPRA